MTEATPLASEQITQEDREAAISTVPDDGSHSSYMMVDAIERGAADDWPLVQAFARHRIAALSASPAPSGQGVSGEVQKPVAYAPKGHLQRYLKGRNTACWVYGSPTADDNDVLYAAPAPSCAPGEVERLTQALRDVVNPLGYLQRIAEAEGSKLGGMAYAIANDLATVQRIASAALSPQGLDAKEGRGPDYDPMKHGMTAKTEVDRLAILLFEAFAKAEPRNGITLYPASYWATFADLARAIIADRNATPSQRMDAATVEREGE